MLLPWKLPYLNVPAQLIHSLLQIAGCLSRLVDLSLFSDYLAIERGLAQLKIPLQVLEYGVKEKANNGIKS